MRICYAHGGGYTELGGIEEFLKKIKEAEYQIIFPRRLKPPKKKKRQIPRLKSEDEGITGEGLWRRIRRLKENIIEFDCDILVIIDDGDCKVANNKLNDTIKYTEKEIFSGTSKRIELIFIPAEPEIEKWFCIDRENVIENRGGGNRSLHQELKTLLETFPLEFDSSKKSCKEKFSERFKKILEEFGIYYSKKTDGPEYLKRANPSKIEEEDGYAKNGIRKLRTLEVKNI